MALTVQEETQVKKIISAHEARKNYDAKVAEKEAKIKKAHTNYKTATKAIDTEYDDDIKTLQDILDAAAKDSGGLNAHGTKLNLA